MNISIIILLLIIYIIVNIIVFIIIKNNMATAGGFSLSLSLSYAKKTLRTEHGTSTWKEAQNTPLFISQGWLTAPPTFVATTA